MATNKVIVAVSVVFVLFLVIASIVSIFKGGSFVIPGLAPQSWRKGEKVELYVNKVTSVHSPIPYRYYDLPVCVPDTPEQMSENLGEVITGNRIESSEFELKMLETADCFLLCITEELNSEQINQFIDLIKDEYVVQWQVDSLPAAVKAYSQKTGEMVYETGFALGYLQEGDNQVVLNNHVHISIHYHPSPNNDNSFNIVLFEVQPRSISYTKPDKWQTICKNAISGSGAAQNLNVDKPSSIVYTYSVEWKKSDTTWEDRWKNYLSLQGEGQIHWFSIVNSLMIVFFLSGLVAVIMTRTIRRDFAKYMEDEKDKDETDETGWKLVRADVFRPPRFRSLLSVLVGSGVQVLAMCIITMVFAVLGFLSPSNSGSLTTAVLVLYVWMGVAGGYSSSRIYLILGGEDRSKNTLMTAFLFPGFIFGIAFFLNFFLWFKGSSGAFPWTTMLAIIALWFCISVPLCFLGSYFAYRKEPTRHPGTVNHIPRQIPYQRWFMHPVFSSLMGGVLPFGAVFIELFFIMSSIWLHRYYFLFGFLFLVFLILVITCAEISIAMCYFHLCSEDWHWWWRSFFTSSTSALYVFCYAIFYYTSRLSLDGFVPSLLYFGYSLIMTSFFFVLTGSIGFYSCYWFVRRIYQAIHSD